MAVVSCSVRADDGAGRQLRRLRHESRRLFRSDWKRNKRRLSLPHHAVWWRLPDVTWCVRRKHIPLSCSMTLNYLKLPIFKKNLTASVSKSTTWSHTEVFDFCSERDVRSRLDPCLLSAASTRRPDGYRVASRQQCESTAGGSHRAAVKLSQS